METVKITSEMELSMETQMFSFQESQDTDDWAVSHFVCLSDVKSDLLVRRPPSGCANRRALVNLP